MFLDPPVPQVWYLLWFNQYPGSSHVPVHAQVKEILSFLNIFLSMTLTGKIQIEIEKDTLYRAKFPRLCGIFCENLSFREQSL